MKYLTSNKIKDYRQEHCPETCSISGKPMTNPALDHDHKTGMVRGVIDREINAFMGCIENDYTRLSIRLKNQPLPDMLERMAMFLRQKQTDVLHPQGAVDLIKRFNRSTKAEQLEVLNSLMDIGLIDDKLDISACNNSKARTDIYASAIKSNKWKPNE